MKKSNALFGKNWEVVMDKKTLICGISLVNILLAFSCMADEQYSVGVGVGALYNGIGANIGFMDKSDFRYVSLGCINIAYTSSSGTSSNCGVGAGWIRSDILSENGKHGLGVHVGATYNTHNDMDETEVFLGIPYIYFFEEMNLGGWNIGITPIVGEHDGDAEGSVLMNLGYQF